MKRLLFIIFSLFSLSTAQIDTTSLRYFPLENGNLWEYEVYTWSEFGSPRTSYKLKTVIGDTLLLNKRYSIVAEKVNSEYIHPEYFRIDSSTSIIYKCFILGGEDFDYYRLNCTYGDTALQYRAAESKYFPYRCGGVYDDIYLNQETTTKTFSYQQGLEGYQYDISYGLGIILMQESDMANGTRWKLIYAKINGEEFGTSTNIGKENQKFSAEFKLKQNYPNPFNSLTNIIFFLPSNDKVVIEVYNTLGQKVETLINKQLNKGNHVVRFNSKNLPSGIYIYRMKAGTFQDYKKMVLVK